MRWIVALTLATVMADLAVAGTIRHDRADTLYTDLALESQFEPVGEVDAGFPCAATLISPRFVLTAAHCVDAKIDPSSIEFNLGGNVFPADAIFLPSDWTGDSVAGNDIALVRLASPVTEVTPAARYRGTSELGAVATFVGAGLTGTGVTGAISGTGGTKRAGRNSLDVLGNFFGIDDRIIFSDFDEPGSPATSVFGGVSPLELEYQLATRDSGAGVFIQEGAQWYLAAVAVFGNDTNGDGTPAAYGDFSGATRVVPHLAWIDSVLCPADTDGNRVVDIEDLLDLLAVWGPCPAPCASDIPGDGVVDIDDLLELLAGWGACP